MLMLKVKGVDCMGKKWLDAMEPECEAYRELFERSMKEGG